MAFMTCSDCCIMFAAVPHSATAAVTEHAQTITIQYDLLSIENQKKQAFSQDLKSVCPKCTIGSA